MTERPTNAWLSVPDETLRLLEAEGVDPSVYHPWRVACGRNWNELYLKLGPLTFYIYTHGIGWTWCCGKGHELRWRRL